MRSEVLNSHKYVPRKPHILIVEDQSADIVGPYMLIHHLGFEVTIALDGGQALKEVSDNEFDLIILDWNMPYVSGEEFLLAIEADGAFRNRNSPLRVVLHSGQTFTLDQFDVLKRSEIVDIWRKPLNVSDICKRLKLLTIK